MTKIKQEATDEILQTCIDLVLRENQQALSRLNPAAVDQLIEAILSAEKIFFVGVGRVMLSLQATAKRLRIERELAERIERGAQAGKVGVQQIHTANAIAQSLAGQRKIRRIHVQSDQPAG